MGIKKPKKLKMPQKLISDKSGFSLTELLAVVTILGIMMAVGVPKIIHLAELNRVRSGAWDLHRDLRFCQQQAMASGQTWGVKFDSSQKYCIFNENTANIKESCEFPQGVSLGTMEFGRNTGEISFNRNGYCKQGGGSVSVKSSFVDKEFTIKVSVYPGRIRLTDG